jgi:hypothetical protein
MTNNDSCCTPRARWGWSPPASEADTRAKRIVDRLLPATGLPLLAFYGAVIGLLLLAPLLPRRAEFGVDGIAFVAGAAWCGLNFWRSRHAHCLVTVTGWSALALLTFAEIVPNRSYMQGDEQLVFLAVLALGLVFEAIWFRARGTNALTLGVVRNRAVATSAD